MIDFERMLNRIKDNYAGEYQDLLESGSLCCKTELGILSVKNKPVKITSDHSWIFANDMPIIFLLDNDYTEAEVVCRELFIEIFSDSFLEESPV
jgi:hypothetical protein